MRGRKPKPIEQRIKEGNAEHRPLPAPVIVGGRPDPDSILAPPDDMPEDAKVIWRRMVPTLLQVGIIDVVDTMALEALCTQWARAKQAGRVINARGLFARGSTGQLTEHPAVAIERNAHAMFLRFAEQYALTPVARTRLGLAELQRRSLTDEMAAKLGEPDLVED
jgi:P27 family predicted phage terminase small subunit